MRERFVRVVGLPVVDDDPAAVPTAADQATDPSAPASAEPGGGGRRGLAALDPGRRGVRALAVAAAAAVAVAAGVAWFARPTVQPVPVRVDASPVASHPPASAAVIVVAVAGRVQRPGLVRLPPGARVADAIEAAGGPLPGTDLSFVNLARKLVDGELLLIGVTPPPGAVVDPGGLTGPGGPVGPVNLNTASLEALQTLPGVGPVTAQHIVEYRSKHNGFSSVSELRQVDGIGDTRYAQLKDLVTV